MKKTVLKIVFIIVAVLLVIDEYTKNGSKIEVYYSLGEKNKITTPEGNYEAYDMYGNAIETGKKMTISNSPIYIVY